MARPDAQQLCDYHFFPSHRVCYKNIKKKYKKKNIKKKYKKKNIKKKSKFKLIAGKCVINWGQCT